MRRGSQALTLLLASVALASALEAADTKGVPRTASGRPDLSGNYDSGTLTPLNRPAAFGDKLYMTVEEANKVAKDEQELLARAGAQSDPNRDAPKAGGSAPFNAPDQQRSEFGAGNVGGYNAFWIDRGSDAFTVDGKFRTSIIYEPKNGRQPAMTPEGMRRMMSGFASFTYDNDGTASWLDKPGPGPFDGPENLALAERCILGFSAGPPMLPGLYNNFKRIVQTDTHVVILMEMVHDARVVRLDSEHIPADQRQWLGDSIGWWEGDTLVVDTTNFHPESSMRGGSPSMHVIERFTMKPDGNVVYRFTVEDKETFTAPWTGEYIWRAAQERVYEYACHEGNYAMGNVLRGARLLEQEALAKKK